MYDIVYIIRLVQNLRHHSSTYDIVCLTYDVIRLIIRSMMMDQLRKRPCGTPLTRVNMGAAFPMIFAFFPVSRSAGWHETRARALNDAQDGLGHMAQRCPLCNCNCADPPSRRPRASWYLFTCPPVICTGAQSVWKREILQRKLLTIGGFRDQSESDPLCA